MSKTGSEVFETRLGWVGLINGETGLQCLHLKPKLEDIIPLLDKFDQYNSYIPSRCDQVKNCIFEYIDGQLDSLEHIQLDLRNTSPFVAAAWSACRTIPVGETRTYGWLAAAAGSPLAARAAGQAMARNRFSLVIPCHRVIGSNGKLTGYGAGGLRVKSKLLEMEQLYIQKRSANIIQSETHPSSG